MVIREGQTSLSSVDKKTSSDTVAARRWSQLHVVSKNTSFVHNFVARIFTNLNNGCLT